VKEERQSDTEYKEFDVQRKANKETSKLIYWSIYYWKSGIYQYSQTKTTDFNENSSSCKY